MKNKYNEILYKKEQEKEKHEKMKQLRKEIEKQLTYNMSKKKISCACKRMAV